MKLISRAELWNLNDRRLDGLTEEVRRDIGCAEEQRRKGYATLEDIRQVRVRKRTTRLSL